MQVEEAALHVNANKGKDLDLEDDADEWAGLPDYVVDSGPVDVLDYDCDLEDEGLNERSVNNSSRKRKRKQVFFDSEDESYSHDDSNMGGKASRRKVRAASNEPEDAELVAVAQVASAGVSFNLSSVGSLCK